MRTLVKSMVGRLLMQLGLLRRCMGDAALIVAFHRVNDDQRDGLTCGTADFDRFCAFFRRCFEVISLAEMVDRLEQGRPVGGTLAITFDDGYRDNLEQAAPILRRYGLPATFFIATGFMSSDHVAWWDRELDPTPRWMRWEDVSKLAAMGFDIGGHTRHHVDLGDVKPEEARAEIRGSKQDLEARLGRDVTLFAYPYGRRENIREENREEVRSAGFRTCAACHGGLVHPGDDPYRLDRVAISDWFGTPAQLAFEVGFGRV